MKIAILDITGRNAVQYNPALCNAIARIEEDVTLLSPTLKCSKQSFKYFRLLDLVPQSWVNRETLLKRLLRAFEVLLNYFIVWIYILIKRPDVLHIQWLPFLEFSSIENIVLWIYNNTCSHTKLYLTIHNVYPHNQSDKQKKGYHKRFLCIDRHFVGYLVHLQSSKDELVKEFNIAPSKITIAYHGIYVPEGFEVKECKPSEKINVILYGTQTKYKGADVFIKAYKQLPDRYKTRISAKIVGRTDKNIYDSCIKDANDLGVEWINRFVDDKELYSAINDSDLILLPYRAITQSGVLLLALSYYKPIITTDLPSFRETLDGYPDNYFFEANNADALSSMLIRFADGELDVKKMKSTISKLNEKYSWEKTARSTYNAYCTYS
ncbi:glycosyltransferase [Xylanibacter caecicola]|uniref:glycosyltransferase n=1 Tax=Xylanibacter caecicola TaxID=2736294 RepID=UPI002585CB05|nr:glycosyltransferase [Xylanibacter caecicola]